jgi:predicted RNA-binding Zn ribbon-like protein
MGYATVYLIEDRMPPLFIGSHTAVDFLNTAFAPDGEAIEMIGDGRELIAWLIEAELLSDAEASKLARRLGRQGTDAVAAEARKLREWTREFFERWRTAPERDYAAELQYLNKALANEAQQRELIRTEDGFELVNRVRIESGSELLALLAAHLARLIAEEDPALLKQCAGTGCTLWFLDRTKAHRRLFCSAAACGNRAKVAAFRERQRE